MLIILLNTDENNENNENKKLFVKIIIGLYIVYILYTVNKESNIYSNNCLKTISTCGHLEYDWFNKFKNWDLFYGSSICISALLLVKDKHILTYNFVYILIIYIINEIFYKCGKGSMLCLFGAFGPLFNYILMKI
jgi:hypothetical protein